MFLRAIITRTLLAATICLTGLGLTVSNPAHAESSGWNDVLTKANGQEVYFNAWGGEPRINAYIDWAASEVQKRHGVTVHLVKISDAGQVVSQIIAEKAAGRTTGGSVDLIWVNGENFATLKKLDLLADRGWATRLPNWRYVDVANKPSVIRDFTVPTDGLEAPWGMAQLVFMYDSARLSNPPRSLEELATYAGEHPGRLTYPQPPNFLGSTFLKQVLIDTIADPSKLQKPVDEATFEADVAPMFAYLDKLHPDLWRRASVFPKDSAQMRQLLADGELDIAFSFNPGDASSAVANGELPESLRSFTLSNGTLGNTHFVAIPFNSSAKEGAMVFANFLMSPEAQARKQDPAVWGDPTVLDVTGLQETDKARFDKLDLGQASLGPAELGPVLAEPHPSWVTHLERAWANRYSGS